MQTITKLIAIAAIMSLPSVAHAASDGTAGATSTGTFGVLMNVQQAGSDVQITGLDDLDYGVISSNAFSSGVASVSSQTDNFCMTRSDGGAVSLTITGPFDPATSNFRISNGAAFVRTAFTFALPSGTSVANTTNTVISNIPVSATCTVASSNMSIRAHTTFAAAQATGIYSGVFTLVVAPQ